VDRFDPSLDPADGLGPGSTSAAAKHTGPASDRRLDGSMPSPARRDHVIIDLRAQRDQEDVKVIRHSRSWIPSSHVLINPTHRTGPDWDSLI